MMDVRQNSPCQLKFNAERRQMELDVAQGETAVAHFAVPPFMDDGDLLTPLRFTVNSLGATFYFFGRYNKQLDVINCVLAGPRGYAYKLSMSDGNSPYGWKVKKHGVTNFDVTPSIWDCLLAAIMGRFVGRVSYDYNRDIMEADAFASEEAIIVPMSIMRISHQAGIMESQESCVGPWCFYGPSMPGVFCRCKLKITISDKPWVAKEKHAMAATALVSSPLVTQVAPSTTIELPRTSEDDPPKDVTEALSIESEPFRDVNATEARVRLDVQLKLEALESSSSHSSPRLCKC